ncbi:hypothetical protein Bca52824_013876 [Brassica carinata]|uniref:mRNA cap-binding protein n=1 Tax=Brassica carinata TaxID=52824 RepID=A0A8X8B3U9_BRACI|nr:hypothetical protein Bca52824_013876 [Brassica carinata]
MAVESSSLPAIMAEEENLDPNTTNLIRIEKHAPAIKAISGSGEEPPSKEIKITCGGKKSKSTTVIKPPHSFQNSWTFWFDNPSSKSNQTTWGSSLRSLYTFATIEEFWSLYNNMHPPTKWVHGADLYCFKHKIEPKWEDPVCANGGKWTMVFPKATLESSWLNTLLALVGEQFEQGDEICGAVLNFRTRGDKISIWTKNAANKEAQLSIGKQWKELLGYTETMGFIFHFLSQEDAKTLDRNAKPQYTLPRREKQDSKEKTEQRRVAEKRENTNAMSDRENSEMEIEEAKETDTRTESTSMEETEGQDTDLRTIEADDRTDWRHKRDPRSSAEKRTLHKLDQSSGHPVRTGVADCQYYLDGSCFFGRSCRFNHPPRNQMGDDAVQPSAHQVRLRATNCEQYLQTGQCSYGRRCWFNHPQLLQRNQMRDEMVQPSPYPGARDCEQYLQKGQCSYGRRCRYNHPPTHLAPYFQKGGFKQGSSFEYDTSVRGDGVEPTRQATTWVRRSDERRYGTESSSRAEKRTRTIQDASDDVVVGQNSWLQRRRAQENVQRGNIDCGQRRESEEERTLRERQAHDPEEQKQKKRKEETLRLDQPNLEEQRKIDIERQRKEARMKIEQIKQTACFDDWSQVERGVKELGCVITKIKGRWLLALREQ